MKRFVLVGWSALLGATVLWASGTIDIPAPLDDSHVKLAVWTTADTSAQIKADQKVYYALEEQLRMVTENKLKDLFGASQATVPNGYVLPVHHHADVGFSGLGYEGDGKSYFIPLADWGGILVFPYGRDDQISAVALYLKADTKFIPLQKNSDYPFRRAWDLQHTEALKKHLEEALKRE